MVRVTFRIGAYFKPAATSRPRVACFHHAAASFCPRHFGAPHCSDIADSEAKKGTTAKEKSRARRARLEVLAT
jgi:hypothetical protein